MANQAGQFFEMASKVANRDQIARGQEAEIGLREATRARTEQITRTTDEDRGRADAFNKEVGDIIYRHTRGSQANAQAGEPNPGLSTVAEPRKDVTLQEAAGSPAFKPLLTNPAAVEEIAQSALRHNQQGVKEWLDLAYKSHKGNYVEAAKQMLLGNGEAALKVVRDAGMPAAVKAEPVPGSNNKKWRLTGADGRIQEFDAEDYLSITSDPGKYLERHRKMQEFDKEFGLKKAESEAAVKLKGAQADQARSAAEYNRGARADAAAAAAEQKRAIAANPPGSRRGGGAGGDEYDHKDQTVENSFAKAAMDTHGKYNAASNSREPTTESTARAATMSGMRGSNPHLRPEIIKDLVNDPARTVREPADPMGALGAGQNIIVTLPIGEDLVTLLVTAPKKGVGSRVYRADGIQDDGSLPMDTIDKALRVSPKESAAAKVAAARAPGGTNAGAPGGDRAGLSGRDSSTGGPRVAGRVTGLSDASPEQP